jgi:predicted TIM-barrel fold metal-dependent hydrolase
VKTAKVVLAVLALSLTAGGAVHAAGKSETPAADHHLHIQGPEVTVQINKAAAASPERFERLNKDLLKTRTLDDVLKALDEAGIRQGVLLSEAYMFASRFSKLPPAEAARLTRIENADTVAAAQASGGRLLAFVGINPLSDFAMDELRYWACRPGVTGIKVQLGNAGFDPRAPDQVAKLAGIFAFARDNRLAIVAHVRSEADYPVSDVDTFIDRVLPYAGNTPVQIAHGGGSGRLDGAAVAAISRYAGALRRKKPGTKNLVFDVALIVVDEKTDPALTSAYAAKMREIGMKRFVFGSDWPTLYSPSRYGEILRSKLPLTDKEWARLLGNRAPYFRLGARRRNSALPLSCAASPG